MSKTMEIMVSLFIGDDSSPLSLSLSLIHSQNTHTVDSQKPSWRESNFYVKSNHIDVTICLIEFDIMLITAHLLSRIYVLKMHRYLDGLCINNYLTTSNSIKQISWSNKQTVTSINQFIASNDPYMSFLNQLTL